MGESWVDAQAMAKGLSPVAIGERPAVMDQEALATTGYVSPIPFLNKGADVVALVCSDHKYENHFRDLLRALGYRIPHIIQVPSGSAVAHPLVAATEAMSESVLTLVAKVVELTEASEVICLGHQGCGGYKEGKVNILSDTPFRTLPGMAVDGAQRMHLSASADAIRAHLSSPVKVRSFFAEVVATPDGDRVKFTEVIS